MKTPGDRRVRSDDFGPSPSVNSGKFEKSPHICAPQLPEMVFVQGAALFLRLLIAEEEDVYAKSLRKITFPPL